MSTVMGTSASRLLRKAPTVEEDDWGTRTRINARRVRAGWASWLGEVPWHTFATLTFDPRKSPSTSEATASKEAFWWCGQIGRWERRAVGWAYAVEGGGGGNLHAHALIVGCSEAAWCPMEATWASRNGRIDLRRVDDPKAAASYICKSIGPNGDIAFSDTLRRYRTDPEAIGDPMVRP